MPKGILEYTVTSREWGKLEICQATVIGGDEWGGLAPLRGTALAPYIPTISGAAIAHAKHGWAVPFMRECGPLPRQLIPRLQQVGWPCAYKVDGGCALAHAGCHPGPEAPICYEPDLVLEARGAGAYVMRAWAEGKIVCVVHGDEHNLM